MLAESLVLMAKAVGIGLLLAVPVGPMALLCLQRSLTIGVVAGLVTGIAIATADAIYAAVAAFGLGAAAAFIEQASWLPVIGGLALVALGLRNVLRTDAAAAPPSLATHLGAFAGALLLTLTNPATILTFAAIIVGLGLIPDLTSSMHGATFVAGVFAGSAGWWALLSAVAGKLGGRLAPAAVRWTRRVAGGAFIAFGLYAIFG